MKKKFLFALFGSLIAEKLKFEEKKPNVILIIADDYGYNDIGYHQNVIKTPNLDEISKDGVRLENYYVQPICTPSRSQLMSGRCQIHTGLQHQLIWAGMPSGLPLDTELLPEAMKNCGYSTFAVGKWHLGLSKSAMTPWGRGFDNYTGYLGGSEDYYTKRRCLDPNKNCGIDQSTEDVNGHRFYTDKNQDYSAFEYVKKAEEYISRRKLHDPFFLYLPLQSVHMPLQVPEKYTEPYKNIITNSKARLKYAGMVSVLDEAVGNLTHYLKKEKIWDDSILIFSTDNGGQAYAGGNNLPYRGNKGGYWEGGIHGVGFVAGGWFENQRSVNQLVNHELIHISDWFPTILEATKCKLAENAPKLDGISQWEMLKDGQKSNRHEILHNIDEMTRAKGKDSRQFSVDYDIYVQSALRHGDWKIFTGDPGYPDYPIPIPPNETRIELTEAHFSQPELPATAIPPRPVPLDRLVRLYNLKDDPLEKKDVSDENMDIVNFLLSRLSFYNSTQVPINFPDVDKLSYLKYHDGFWKPWLG